MAKLTVRHALFSYLHPKKGWQVAFRGDTLDSADVSREDMERGKQNDAFLPEGQTELETPSGSVGQFPLLSEEEQIAWAREATPDEILEEALRDPEQAPVILAAEKAARRGKARKRVADELDEIIAAQQGQPAPQVDADGNPISA